MTAPSYSKAAIKSSPSPFRYLTKAQETARQRRMELMQPPPASMTLTAALQAMQELIYGQTVYLMDREYLQNWFIWALHQTVPPSEESRTREALRLAALQLGLTLPHDGMAFKDPGPVDSTPLSFSESPLELNPNAHILTSNDSNRKPPPLSKRGSASVSARSQVSAGEDSRQAEKVECLAVAEGFYETLRSVHGVICEDKVTISFQPCTGESEPLVLYHKPAESRAESAPMPRPIEFRRKVILEPFVNDSKEPLSLMDKLMQEDELNQPVLVPTVEVHPIKLVYTLREQVDPNRSCESLPMDISNLSMNGSSHRSPLSRQGYVLVSRGTDAVDALLALIRTVEPKKATQSVRLWSKRIYPYGNNIDRATSKGDGYELIDLVSLAEKKKVKTQMENPRTTMRTFCESHHADVRGSDVDILVETRKTVNSDWPRQSLDLADRVQVGDFVDAQDVADKWYEAVVREVEEDTLTVHYTGWASRWNTKVRRRPGGTPLDGVPPKLKAVAPLWARTSRWRERLSVGDSVEVRDSSSLVTRPKWYKGVIRKIGKVTDPPVEITGGADLEEYPVDGDPEKTEKLYLLQRKQQILVEVEQEKTEKAGAMPTSPGEGDLAAGLSPQPPYLRWVSLYGEEVCELGTHLEKDKGGPVTLSYDFDSHRKPVMVLKPHPALGSLGFMRESLRGAPPAPGSVGLHNLGNSCFMNSTIQCLNHIDVLTQYFLHDKYMSEMNKNNPLGSGGNVSVSYASLLKKMWGGEFSILVPRTLKQTVANFAPQFDNSYQHDCEEFCQFLMDGLHEDLNRVKEKPYVEELEGFGMEDEKAAIESWRKHLLRHDSIIVDHCQGMHRSHLTCPQCGRESIKFDVYSSISLPLVPSSKHQHTIQLEDCIEKFMEGEQLDERNAWYCPKCRKHVCALKLIALWTIPDILILHLKRFTFDTCMTSGSMLRAKIDAKVEFPIENLDLTKFVLGPHDDGAPPVYKLIGVSEHTGPTANSGHYTATIRNSVDGQWYRANDSHIGRTSGEASITGGAYLLFYQRSKGTTKWGGMDKVMRDRGVDPYGGLETDQEGFKQVKAKKKKAKAG